MLALGRKKQRVLIGLSILPNLFLAFLLSSGPLLTHAPHHHCHLPSATPSPEVLNASLPWEKVQRPGGFGGLSQCKEYLNGSGSDVVGCRFGWDYNVTEGLQHNIVTEVTVQPCASSAEFRDLGDSSVHTLAAEGSRSGLGSHQGPAENHVLVLQPGSRPNMSDGAKLWNPNWNCSISHFIGSL